VKEPLPAFIQQSKERMGRFKLTQISYLFKEAAVPDPGLTACGKPQLVHQAE
jgi:hypothetical protein